MNTILYTVTMTDHRTTPGVVGAPDRKFAIIDDGFGPAVAIIQGDGSLSNVATVTTFEEAVQQIAHAVQRELLTARS